MRSESPSAEDLDVLDPRSTRVEPAALAEALDTNPAKLARVGASVLSEVPGRRRNRPLSFDEALATAAGHSLASATGDVRVTASIVRTAWPEVVRAALPSVGDAGDGDAQCRLLLSDLLAPVPHAEPWREGPLPPLCVLVDLAPAAAGLREAAGPADWAMGTARLARLFGRRGVTLPDEGRAADMPVGRSFLEEGPYWPRLAHLLAADLPRAERPPGPAAARRLAWYVGYLLDAPPIDRWKMEAGVDKVMPRVKHLVEALAADGGVDWDGARHPETLRATAGHDAVSTLLGYLRLVSTRG